MSEGSVRIGVFVPPATGVREVGSEATLGKVPVGDHARLVELLAALEGVEVIHDLDPGTSHIRNGRVWCGGLCLNDLDLFFWIARIDRSIGSYALDALKTLSLDTKVVTNPVAFDLAMDKYWAHLTLKRAGVRVAETVLFDHRNIAAVAPVIEEWGGAVLKPRRGRFGRGVLFVEHPAALRDLAGYLEDTTGGTPDKAFLLERFYENDPGDWIGTTLINGAVMYGYRKRPSRWTRMGPGAWKVYDHGQVGGEVELCDVPPAHEDAALRAQKALGAEMIGFDMILHRGEPIIVDENTLPGLYSELFRGVGRDMAWELCRLVQDSLAAANRQGPTD